MANTGYKITTYKDKNIYSPTYNTTKEEKEYDEDLCPTRNYYTSISFDINTESSTDSYPSDYFKIEKIRTYDKERNITIDWGDGTVEELSLKPSVDNTFSHYYTDGQHNYTVNVKSRGNEYSGISTFQIYYRIPMDKPLPPQRVTKINKIITNELITIGNFIYSNVDEYDVPEEWKFKGFDKNFKLIINERYPEDGKPNNLDMISFLGCFQTEIKDINSVAHTIELPKRLFANVRRNTVSLTSTFINLISNNYDVPLFTGNINEILDGLDLKKVDDVNGCFQNQRGLTGEALPIIAQLSHLTNIKDYRYCFKNCTGLSDYDQIPSDWK